MRSNPLRIYFLLVIVAIAFVAIAGLWVVSTGAPTAMAMPSARADAQLSSVADAPACCQAAQGISPSHDAVAPLCSPDWTIVSSPNVGTYTNRLYGTAAIASNDVWAVGYYSNGTINQTLAEHWNGTQWVIVYTPNMGTDNNDLTAVTAIASNNVWAVGYYLGDTSYYRTLVEHWDGTQWSVVNSPNVGALGNRLASVDARTSGDIWAVGFYSTATADQTLTEHWDGNSWTVVYSPNIGTHDNSLHGVTVVSASDVWAVGNYSTGPTTPTLVERWDGMQWTIIPSPNGGPYGSYLTGVDAVSSNQVWAVGYYVTGSGNKTLVERWDGTQWSVINSPNANTGSNGFQGVHATASGDVWAVGSYGDNSVYRTLVEHWNGTQWSVISSPNVGTDDTALYGVTAASASDVWAVGYHNIATSQTLTERYNPCTATSTPAPSATHAPSATPVPSTSATATVVPTACVLSFSDVQPGSTFYPYVRCLACRGIINGYPDGAFRPNNPVTRGQLSKIVSNSAGFSDAASGQQFQDVPPGSTFYVYIFRLSSRGFISGYACGGAGEPCGPASLPYFRPNSNVTRGQTSKIVASARALPAPPSGQQSFQDVAVGSTFWQWIEALATTGAISGYPCGNPEPCVPPANLPYFRPNSNVTRGQSTKIVANAFFPSCQTP